MNIKDTLKAFPSTLVEKLIDAIRPVLEEAANEVADELTEMLSNLSVSDLAGLADDSTPRRGGRKASAKTKTSAKVKSGKERLTRRSPEEIEKAANKVASLVKKKKSGMRAEEIRAALDMDVRELPRVIKAALDGKKITILSGAKRSTTYGVKGAKVAASKKAAPKAKKAASKTKKAASKANGVETAAAAG